MKGFRDEFKGLLYTDELYLGYYLHLIQDMVFRRLVYEKYKWDPSVSGNVGQLHMDYRRINRYVIESRGIGNRIELPVDFEKEEINRLYPFDVIGLLCELENDFAERYEGESFFFTNTMADEFIREAAAICLHEMDALKCGKTYVDEYAYAWRNPCSSLLKTTQNTRELGGYRAKNGQVTKWRSLLRSDVPNYPCETDFQFLKNYGIRTMIDMRGEKDVARKPSGFAHADGIDYFNYSIDEGSGVPESAEAVPESYLDIACTANMGRVFRCIADAKGGVMFHCTAGKDRTGVVSAILLSHAGVSDADIIENYVLTKEYGKERLELVHKNFPELDMNIVTPNERFMQAFLELFREKFGNTERYFEEIGLNRAEIERITDKLISA